jgi:hypothetical protein
MMDNWQQVNSKAGTRRTVTHVAFSGEQTSFDFSSLVNGHRLHLLCVLIDENGHLLHLYTLIL